MTSDCVSYWHGEPLGPVERACIRSVLRHGHALALYCYRDPGGVPGGVELRDAAAILPESSLADYRKGRLGIFADWFRYELLRRGLGTWVDLDLYLLRPLDLGREYLFGLQEPGVVNNAVLRLPPGSDMLRRLLGVFGSNATPPWLSPRERLEVGLRRLVEKPTGAAGLPWGTTGPRALTAIARELRLDHWALPVEVFYPMPWQKAAWIVDPQVRLEDVAGAATVAVHLWNEQIKQLKQAPPPPGSFLARLVSEGEQP